MSHVATLSEVKIASAAERGIEALTKAVKARGLEIRKDKNYKWYGQWVNDYDAVDAAFRNYDPKEFGRNAEYVIYDPKNPDGYEIGVVPHHHKDGSYTLMVDFWGDSNKNHIVHKVQGRGCEGLMRDYQAHKVVQDAAPLLEQGYSTSMYINPKTQELVPVVSDMGVPDELQAEINSGDLVLYNYEQ
jgi:hypothetical protein